MYDWRLRELKCLHNVITIFQKKRKSVLNSFLINVNLLSNSSNNCQETWITLKIFAKLAHNKMLKSYSGKMKMLDRSINFDLSKSGHLESHLTNVQYKVKIFRTLPLKVPDSSLGHLKETKTSVGASPDSDSDSMGESESESGLESGLGLYPCGLDSDSTSVDSNSSAVDSDSGLMDSDSDSTQVASDSQWVQVSPVRNWRL